MSKGRVLIVEDQEVISTNIEILLRHKGYDIVGTAITGTEVLEMIITGHPDIILMDISLPGEYDGIELTNIIRQRWDIPVVYLTAKTDEETLIRAKGTDAYGYLTKDISLQEQLPILVEFVLFRHKVHKEKADSDLALVESEEKFRSIASSARDAIIFLDNDGKVSYWNSSAEKIFGYSQEEAIGSYLYDLISPESYKEYYKKGFTDYRDNGQGDFIGRMLEIDTITKGLEVIPVELSLSSVKLKGKWCACGIIRDVSTRKTTEMELERLIEEIQISREVIEQHANELISLNHKLQESEEQLQELNASKDKFFSIISHDLKNPFQGLLGYSEILARDIDMLSKDEIKEVAGDFHENAQNVFKLLENLLQWSRIQRGVIEFEPTEVDIDTLIRMNIDLLNGTARQKQITLAKESEPGTIAYADANMVNTVIRNLMTNSVKFTSSGGKISVRAERTGDEIEVSITDDGVGMTDEVQAKIFKIDSHHTTKGTANEKGTGLGLILCKDLVEKNHGHIWVKSNPGEGTTFFFTLPASDGE